jgi:hypothetical protein
MESITLKGVLMRLFISLIILLIAVGGILYLIAMSQINSTEPKVRDMAANLDSNLTERYHILKRILPILAEAGISDNETLNQPINLRIGMLAPEQKLVYNQMKAMEPVLMDLLEKDAKLSSHAELSDLVHSFINLEPQIVEAGAAYNLAIERYNEAIAKFPARLIADHKKKYARSYFDIPSLI